MRHPNAARARLAFLSGSRASVSGIVSNVWSSFMRRVIWQYWETAGRKPKYIDGLYELAKKNSGVEVILVTPQTLRSYIPNIPDPLFEINEVAHRADMIRTMLVMLHGGMWLDSDAIVLCDLGWLYDLLEKFDFVGFNDRGRLKPGHPLIRVNCFLSRPGGRVVSEWVRRQHAKFPKVVYGWYEIGSELLHTICLEHSLSVKILPYERICPIRWNEVERFIAISDDVGFLRKCFIVMMSNQTIAKKIPSLQDRTLQQIAAGDYVLSAIVRQANAAAPHVFDVAEIEWSIRDTVGWVWGRILHRILARK
jgi:hypothetical protein